MGALEEAIREAIKAVADRFQIEEIITGTVVNVSETACDVEREDAPTIHDVRLSAIDDDLQTYCVTVPADRSSVVIGIIEGLKTEAVILRCSEIQAFRVKINGKTFVINAEGVVVDGTNLVQWMNKVHSDMNTLKTLLQNSTIAGNGAPAAIVFNPQTTAVE